MVSITACSHAVSLEPAIKNACETKLTSCMRTQWKWNINVMQNCTRGSGQLWIALLKAAALCAVDNPWIV